MRLFGLLLFSLSIFLGMGQTQSATHLVEPGDTWTALAFRYHTVVPDLQTANLHPNRQRQPVIGRTIIIPTNVPPQMGTLVREEGDLVATAVHHQTSPWKIALQNELNSPYRPQFYHSIFIPGGEEPPRDLPSGFSGLELSQNVAYPGQAVGVRGLIHGVEGVTAMLADQQMDTFVSDGRFLALSGTGAFFGSRQPELLIQANGQPAWSQPWQFADSNTWEYQEITLTGEAAEIDQASIQEERERLFAIWEQDSPQPQWNAPFQLPIHNYLSISSPFGARRSYNGGPYTSYHEGVDFSAYGGTSVHAAAAGTVNMAEQLYVRGGAVIIDHGLGIYSGYYHMSEVSVVVGDIVQSGQVIGV
ncbi:MAG: LysM peptidoglycan-binding domain-containing M23 family metallopeptidase, partial [Chloroflexi bacterium]|nr:LysM peptidoglycan-binding domain-containing M23 family metallopeptidase [Chloroflexota bacterium]